MTSVQLKKLVYPTHYNKETETRLTNVDKNKGNGNGIIDTLAEAKVALSVMKSINNSTAYDNLRTALEITEADLASITPPATGSTNDKIRSMEKLELISTVNKYLVTNNLPSLWDDHCSDVAKNLLIAFNENGITPDRISGSIDIRSIAVSEHVTENRPDADSFRVTPELAFLAFEQILTRAGGSILAPK